MKKGLAVFLLVMLLVLIASCGLKTETEESTVGKTETKQETEKKELVVCVESRSFLDNSMLRSQLYEYIDPECERIKFMFLPGDGADREAACSRIRVELMSGGGPDVFMVSCSEYEENLFQNVEKNMRMGMFLPMDRYVGETEQKLLDEQPQVLLDAGRTEEGQLVLPLMYTLPIFVIEKNDTIENEGPFKTWDALYEASEQDEAIHMVVSEQRFLWQPARFGVLGNYDKEKITLTQKEVEEIIAEDAAIEDVVSIQDEAMAGAANGDVFSFSEEDAHIMGLQRGMQIYKGVQELTKYEDRSVLAVYNNQGGLTARVTGIAAVNRNTAYPEDAVKIATVLYNDVFQAMQYEKKITPGFGMQSLAYISSVTTGKNSPYWHLLEPYVEEINAVRFYSDMETALGRFGSAHPGTPEEQAENIVSRIKMMMAE